MRGIIATSISPYDLRALWPSQPDMSHSLAKAPCVNCRGDRRRPKCRRCETKGLDCEPVQRKQVFRLGSTANLDASFRHDQIWVNSQPRNWRQSTGPDRVSQCRSTLALSNEQSDSPPASEPPVDNFQHNYGPASLDNQSNQVSAASPHAPLDTPSRLTTWSSTSPSHLSDAAGSMRSSFVSTPDGQHRQLINAGHEIRDSGHSSRITQSDLPHHDTLIPSCVNGDTTHPSSQLQESCLMRYFIEELSPWFDHCDELRHFQLVVPRRAERCLALRNAVFAVSARHLSRLPQYMTSRGIVYQGELLPDLTKSTSLEYMLKCIPELTRFHEIQDPTHQENIMATTVILRQYEEMEEELEEGEVGNYANDRVNFLAITHTIINTMISTPLDHPLATAAFWITVRQDVYCALTRQQTPEFRFGSESLKPSVVNTMVIFTSEVAKWRWGTKTTYQWEILKKRQHQLDDEYSHELSPLLDEKADRARGSIFPRIWYLAEFQVTAVQHFRLGEMILIAESPYLEKARGPVHRKAEAQVREIVLSLCGIAICHPRCQPALVNAVIAITLYGEYFTQPDERDALLGIINRTMDLHAWPMRKAHQALCEQWEMADAV
ncbi:unnamed protein product [Penicillium olsonii]|uniref:Zn(2)-C6 fungal-type domain-containing protein n=1 Tax=Penicillium olsonii TaxID=99116 RepID=A0A9W4HQY5_PENOL|nr:unnamed protein product [Penicillium olsonii]